jgi:uncharacterized membrane protein
MRRMAESADTAWDRAPLGLLWGFGALAVLGYGAFGVDPGRLAGVSELAVWFYGVSFRFFAQGHVLLAGLVLMLLLWRRADARWLVAFVLIYGASLSSELAGTAWGLPFGAYAYTSLLGPKWLGLVPVLIPLSWFSMAVPSYALASRLRGGAGGVAWRLAVGSLLLLTWDLALDPAMSLAVPYWVWGETGPYYGMPWLNLAGWYGTGLVLMGILEWVGAREWLAPASTAWFRSYYGANLVVPFGMVVVGGMWLAAGVTVSVLGGVWVVSRFWPGRPTIDTAASTARRQRRERREVGA